MNEQRLYDYLTPTIKEYVTNAIKPLFGYESGSTFKTLEINASEHSYDVVLFIKETESQQDEDQGQTFTGNLFIETTSGEQITGQR